MKLHRFVMLHLNPEPKGWGPAWNSFSGNSEHEVQVARLNIPAKPRPRSKAPISPGWPLVAVLEIVGPPDLDDENRVLIPPEVREPCETALELAADMVSVLEGCSRSILSPVPCVALEFENEAERKFLEASAGIKADAPSSEMSARQSIRHDDPKLINCLTDRVNGVALLAEAYSGRGESGQYRDFVRFLELAFGLSSSQLGKKLTQFLSPALGYTRDEIEEWLSMRNPLNHAGLKDTPFIGMSSDIRTFLMRMEQACLDVLFNKADWAQPSKTRRNAWIPDAITTSATGHLIVKQHTKPSLIVRSFDEFGVYPRDLHASSRTPGCMPSSPSPQKQKRFRPPYRQISFRNSCSRRRRPSMAISKLARAVPLE